MRVFLAGATGVIGSQLVPQLLEAGHDVTAMTRSVLRAAQLEAVGTTPVVCDVFDADGVRAAMADASPKRSSTKSPRCPRASTGRTPTSSTRTIACGPKGPGSSSMRRSPPAQAAS